MLSMVSLNDDVLSLILCFCDVPSLLRFSQACKNFHSLAFARTTWLHMVKSILGRVKLEFSGDKPLQSLSTEALVRIARRIFRGPSSWASSACLITPRVRHKKVVRFPIGYNHADASLLADEKHLMCRGATSLECWNVSEDRLVWKYTPHADGLTTQIQILAHEIVIGGDAVVIMIRVYFRCIIPNGSTEVRSFIEILRLNFPIGKSERLYSVNTEGFKLGSQSPRICGEFAAVCSETNRKIILIHWKTGRHTKIYLSKSNWSYDLELIPGHLIVLDKEEKTNICRLRAWSTDNFLAQRRLFDSASLDSPPLFQQDFKLAAKSSLKLFLSVSLHPLFDNAYRLWVFVTCGEPDFHAPKTSGQKDGEDEESLSIAASYHISFSSTSTLKAPTFSRTSFASSHRNFHNLYWSTACVSSSGHVLLRVRETWPTQNVILPLRELPQSRGGSNKLPHFHRGRHMSIYGGALVHLERDSEFETDGEEEHAILCVINYFD